MKLWQELERRNVFRVSLAYVVMSAMLVQVGDIVFEATGAPAWVMRTLIAALAIGLLPVALFAWAYELTPEGLKRESEVDRSRSVTHRTGHRLNLVTILLAIGVGGLFVWDRLLRPTPAARVTEAPASASTRAPGEPASGPPVVDGVIAVAVLPFVNLSSDREQDYFSDGISEELLNVLANIPDIRVAARTSSFQFKGENRNVGEIARILKVNHVLEGSVRKAGDRLRVTAQLINASSGYHVWSETYDRQLDDVFAIQDEISAAIGAALREEFGLVEEGLVASLPRAREAANTAAYDAFLHGRHLINQRGNRNITEAVRQLERAIRLDPNYAPAHAHLAIAITLLLNSSSTYGDLTQQEVLARATPHIDVALALDPELPEIWGARALLEMNTGRYDEALADAARALELNPIYVDAVNWTFNTQQALGDYAGAEATLRRLIDLDPLSIVGRLNYILSVASYENPGEARRMSEALVDDHPWAGYVALSNVAFVGGRFTESARWLLLAYGQDPLDRFSNQILAATFGALGLDHEAERFSDATRHLAIAYAGRYEEAVALIEEELHRDPQSLPLHGTLADTLYFQGRFEAALPHYRAAVDEQGLVLGGLGDALGPTLRFAFVLERLGRGVEAAALEGRVAKELAAVDGSLLRHNPLRWLDRATAAQLEGNRDEALRELGRYVASGALLRRSLEEPLWASSAEDPGFVELASAYAARIERERQTVLELICRANPIPDAWQPLPATCAGGPLAAVR